MHTAKVKSCFEKERKQYAQFLLRQTACRRCAPEGLEPSSPDYKPGALFRLSYAAHRNMEVYNLRQRFPFLAQLQGVELHHRPPGYEPGHLLLIIPCNIDGGDRFPPCGYALCFSSASVISARRSMKPSSL